MGPVGHGFSPFLKASIKTDMLNFKIDIYATKFLKMSITQSLHIRILSNSSKGPANFFLYFL